MTNSNNLKEKFAIHQKALDRLGEALDIKKSAAISHDIIMDSCIQRFEFSYELLWKALKKLLSQKEAIEANSPKQVLRESFKIGWIDQKDENSWLDMLESRNLTSHTYEQTTADKVYQQLPKYHKMMSDLNHKLVKLYTL